MYLVILLAAAAILGGVVVVAMGRGGELALFDRDLPVRITRPRTPGEVATMRLPFGLIGFQTRATGEALIAAANLLAKRDAEIAELRREIWRLGGDDQMVVSDVSAPGIAGPDFGGPDFAGSDFAGQEVGAASYTSASLAAWYDSIAQSESAEEAPVMSDPGHDETSRLDETSQQDQDSRP